MALNDFLLWLSNHMTDWQKIAFIFMGSVVIAIFLVNAMMGPDNPG